MTSTRIRTLCHGLLLTVLRMKNKQLVLALALFKYEEIEDLARSRKRWGKARYGQPGIVLLSQREPLLNTVHGLVWLPSGIDDGNASLSIPNYYSFVPKF